ncbi:hypothetical protein JCM8097_002442 [Rhodosporidiobolus ruineniae]
MGVKDLTTWVKKLAPAALTPYPSLRAFAGQRFAIDANLLSTKFFFAGAGKMGRRAPFPPNAADAAPVQTTAAEERHRLARAWYFFLHALRRYDIQPVVVFDGETRPKEKERENERRRRARELQRQRGLAEALRGTRLREVQGIWEGVAKDEERREQVARAFREALHEQRMAALAPHFDEDDSALSPDALPVHPATVDASLASSASLPVEPAPSSAPPPPPPFKSTSTPPPSPPSSPPPADFLARAPSPAPQTAPKAPSAPVPAPPEPLAATPVDPTRPLPLPPLPLNTTDVPSSADDLSTALLVHYNAFVSDYANPIYSKNQTLVTLEERAFWALLVSPPPLSSGAEEGREGGRDDAALEIEEDKARAERDFLELEEIIERSDRLEKSHISRSNFVPKEAFADVRALIEALGVPFLEPHPSQPHEAEGVCSALFAHGLVDMVVSDDTDVLVYGAPQLRRISTAGEGYEGREGREGMAVVDPGRIRTELGLSREEMVDWALLCGTDFTERIPYLGPATALKLLRRYGTIEALLASHPVDYPSARPLVPVGGDVEAYLQTVRDARAIFLGLPQLEKAHFEPTALVHAPTEEEEGEDDVDGDSDAAPALSSSPFIGSLDPRPHSPRLKTLLRRFGIRKPRSASLSSSPSPSLASSLSSGSGPSDVALPPGGNWGVGEGEGEEEEYGAEDETGADWPEVCDGVEEDWSAYAPEELDTLERADKSKGGREGRREAQAKLEDAFERMYLS